MHSFRSTLGHLVRFFCAVFNIIIVVFGVMITSSNNNNYDNLYGAVTQPYHYKGASQALNRVSLSEQVSFKLRFK